MARGSNLLSKMCIIFQCWGIAMELYPHYRFGNANVGNDNFLSFCFSLSGVALSHIAAGQVMDSKWLNGHNSAARRKEGGGKRFPRNPEMIMRETMLIQATEYKKSLNKKKTEK